MKALAGIFILVGSVHYVSFAQTSPPLEVFVRNVAVSTGSLHVDSADGRSFASGIATFDLETRLDSALLHVYWEEVPIPRHWNGSAWEGGRSLFRKIDSLCVGDLGWVRPGTGRHITWRVPMQGRESHARIKIGTANLAYVETESRWYLGDSTSPKNVIRREFDNRGLDRANSYNRFGQVLQQPSPFLTQRYDDNGRPTFMQSGQGAASSNLVIFGYEYNTNNRLVKRHYLDFNSTPEQPGRPFKTETTGYDSQGRTIRFETSLEAFQFQCDKPYSFAGLDVTESFYRASQSTRPDSSTRSYTDSATGLLKGRSTGTYTYFSDAKLKTSHSVFRGNDVQGTCWGLDVVQEENQEFMYDRWRHAYKTRTETRISPSGPFQIDSTCQERDYDERGNILVEYSPSNECVVRKVNFSARYDAFDRRVEISYGGPDSWSNRTQYRWELLDLDLQPAMEVK